MKKLICRIITALFLLIHCLPANGAWVEQANPDPELIQLRAVWGDSPTNIYSGGDYGTLLRNDGTGWALIDVDIIYNIYGIAGTSLSNVFAVCDMGDIWRFNGSDWAKQNSLTTNRLRGIWISPEGQVFACGEGGTILRSLDNGTSWVKMTVPAETPTMQALWGTSGANVYAAGSSSKSDGHLPPTVIHYNGTNWGKVYSSTYESPKLQGIWGSSDKDIWVVGEVGFLMHSENGIEWTVINHGLTEQNFRDIWGDAADNVYVSVDGDQLNNYYASFLHYDGRSWSIENIALPEGKTSLKLHGIEGIRANSHLYLYAVGGNDGTILLNDISFASSSTTTMPETTTTIESTITTTTNQTSTTSISSSGGGSTPAKSTTSSVETTTTTSIQQTTSSTTSVQEPPPETTSSTAVSSTTTTGHVCPVRSAIGDEDAPELLTLRQYRDTVLLKTIPGIMCVTLYYIHGPEILEIFREHPSLEEKCGVLARNIVPSIARGLESNTLVSLSSEHYRDIINLIAGIRRYSSPGLKKSLDSVEKMLLSGRYESDFFMTVIKE